MERSSDRELLVGHTWRCDLLPWGLGARMAMALPTQAFEGYSHEKDVPHGGHRVYGE